MRHSKPVRLETAPHRLVPILGIPTVGIGNSAYQTWGAKVFIYF